MCRSAKPACRPSSPCRTRPITAERITRKRIPSTKFTKTISFRAPRPLRLWPGIFRNIRRSFREKKRTRRRGARLVSTFFRGGQAGDLAHFGREVTGSFVFAGGPRGIVVRPSSNAAPRRSTPLLSRLVAGQRANRAIELAWAARLVHNSKLDSYEDDLMTNRASGLPVSRRDLLKAAGGALAAGPAAFARPQSRTSQRVLVAGAGISGLSCGYELMQRGHDVTVLEALGRPGGHVLTVRDNLADGLYADAGAEHFYRSAYQELYKYIEEFALPVIPYPSQHNIKIRRA